MRTAVILAVIFCVGAARAEAQQDTTEGLLYEAKSKFEARDYEGASPQVDLVISRLSSADLSDPIRRQRLIDAYSLRAQIMVGTKRPTEAKDDLRRLFALDPSITNSGSNVPTYQSLFDEVRKSVVGTLNLTVTPANASVQIDGKPVAVGSLISLMARDYSVRVTKPSYQPKSQTITITPGDTALELRIDLERVSSTIRIVTVPSEVDVTFDNRSAGHTAIGPPSADYADKLAKAGVQASAASAVFELAEIPNGRYRIDFKKDCYKSFSTTLNVERPDDIDVEPIRLERATGTLQVQASSDSDRILLNGESRGTGSDPLELCEGHYAVDVRSAYGRYLEDVDIAAGDKKTITAKVKPAIAMLAYTGLPESLRGQSDPRPRLARAFNTVDALFFTPKEPELGAALSKNKVVPGWLAFDPSGEPRIDEARNYLPSGRSEASIGLGTALAVQGVAEIAIPSTEAMNDVLLTLLAAGSGRPDTLLIRLNDESSVDDAKAQLTRTTPLTVRSTEIQVVDVRGMSGPVVVGVPRGGPAAGAGIVPGDILVKANDKPVSDTNAFQAIVDAATSDIAVEFRDRSDTVSTPKSARLTVVPRPAIIGLDDRSLLPNKLILDFRRQLAASPNSRDEAVLRLNLAVALLQVEDLAEARAELEKIKLPDGPGVSNGTVQYLLGLCYKYQSEPAAARTAFDNALRSADARLTADGPLISDLVQAERTGQGRPIR